MNSPLQRSEIGEVWIQPELHLVPDLPKEEETSDRPPRFKGISGYECKFCENFSNETCTQGKQFHKDKGCDRFTTYKIYCIDLWIGDEIIYYQNLTHFKGWMKGIVREIDQAFITLESGRILPHSGWKAKPKPIPDLRKEKPCNECHHFEQLNAGCSAFALCKLKNVEVRIDNKSDCKGFKSWKHKEEAKPLNHCSSCNSFDSAIKNDSPWAFCLLKGKYIARDELTTCDDFKPIIPYQAPAKTRRSRGDGSGSIVKRFLSKKTKKETKSYEQYWYDYELWESGVCLRKGTAYIPKNKLEEIELMNKDKKPVKLILEALGKTV